MPRNKTAAIAGLSIILALFVLLAGPMVKYGVLPWTAGLGLFALGSLVSGVGGIVCLIALLRRRGGRLAIGGMICGLGALAVLVAIIVNGSGVPRIHDITTDTITPPQFVAITPAARGAGTNTLVYDPALASQQTAGYPTLKPLVVAKPPAEIFDKALRIVTARGWQVAVADASAGRIEATATAGWWGFKDDVVIRLTPTDGGTRIDIRSVSRVGEGDFGANAHRIEGLLKAIGG
ncbi:DUF1499 domain-containing protein [Sphingomonas sp. 28-63-12]|uniref:DUF1499 domain-containing protein n=1 Tax=Sphingomonas sp. 28-63-12 TaxID=1970434 RepID=UPI000BD3E0E9|nr:MAG: hypothetical protein B7Y47_13035 [Sphingomonas sp. 28-63-12]